MVMIIMVTILMTPTMMMIKVNKEWSAIILGEWYLQWVSFNFPFSWREIISGNDVFPLSDSQIHFLFQTQMQELQMFRKSFSFFFCQKNHCMLQIILVEDGIWVNSVSDIERPILQTYQFLLCFCPQFEDGYCFSLSDIVRSNHI